jgi:hypothetical protein
LFVASPEPIPDRGGKPTTYTYEVWQKDPLMKNLSGRKIGF